MWCLQVPALVSLNDEQRGVVQINPFIPGLVLVSALSLKQKSTRRCQHLLGTENPACLDLPDEDVKEQGDDRTSLDQLGPTNAFAFFS